MRCLSIIKQHVEIVLDFYCISKSTNHIMKYHNTVFIYLQVFLIECPYLRTSKFYAIYVRPSILFIFVHLLDLCWSTEMTTQNIGIFRDCLLYSFYDPSLYVCDIFLMECSPCLCEWAVQFDMICYDMIDQSTI